MPNNRRGFGRATSGEEWRASQQIGKLIALPSGNIAYISHHAPEQEAAALASIDNLCKMALVYPRIVDNPKAEDEIGIADLSLSDKLTILIALLKDK